MLDWGRLVCINDGSSTRMDVNHGRDSALDLTLVSDNLAGKCEWNIMKQRTIGNYHFPIVVKIGVDITKVEVVRNPRRKFKTAEWGIFF